MIIVMWKRTEVCGGDGGAWKGVDRRWEEIREVQGIGERRKSEE